MLCADGHVEGFHKKDGIWRNDKGGSGKLSLAYDAGQNLFVMHDIVTHMSYFYGERGRLVRVEDGTGHRSQYLYEDGILCGITTFTGLRIGISVSDGRLRELVDVLGRTVRYEYDDKKGSCASTRTAGALRGTSTTGRGASPASPTRTTNATP